MSPLQEPFAVRLKHRHVRDVISAAEAPVCRQPDPGVSELATASRSDRPRAIRDRLAPEEFERLLIAVRAGASRKALAAEYGISRRSVDRLAAS